MTLHDLYQHLVSTPRRNALRALLRSKRSAVIQAAGSATSLAIAAMVADRRQPCLVIAPDPDTAGYLAFDLQRLLDPAYNVDNDNNDDDSHVMLFPSGYKRHIKYGTIDAPNRILRTRVLNNWYAPSHPDVVVTYPDALAEAVADRNDIEQHTLTLTKGADTDGITAIARWLDDNGFQEQDYVYEPGQYAVRGSIVDIFSYSSELPYRLDFFDSEIDSIRTFDVGTQLSQQQLDHIIITADIENAANASAHKISLLDFIPDDTHLIVLADDIEQSVRNVCSSSFSDSAAIALEGDKDALNNLIDADAFAARYAAMHRCLVTAGAVPPPSATATYDMQCAPQAIYHKNFDLIAPSFERFIDEGYHIYILSDSAKQTQRLRTIFDDRGDNIPFTPVDATLHEGFVDRTTSTCVFTDHQIFDRFHKYTMRSDRARAGKMALSLKELSQIEVGDYIVHIDHGIGRFAGLLRTDAGGGRMQEMVKLVYQNDDIVFVSIHSLHKLSKYRGKEGVPPKISKLGSGAWQRIKDKTKERLKDIARDLIKLYAQRQADKGFAFSPDSYLQHELEASFIYEDTPDQLAATIAVKADMESERPMDRLICGDVGFGKTEVAIRAAFKAATDGKQVAVLVPTTVLAYQHYNTFRERLADMPVRVEYLSRARSPKQTKAILADLADGKIDIIIGTHKLIGNSVKFKDLGLLVVDEEQKFGVAVKERLKQMKTNVDTLTMSATPIPRTLQFSLMGARDLSAITTPPPNRYPILTTVGALSDDLLAEAINFELSRNGQIFIVNNRIEGLYELQKRIQRIIPDARTIVGHGQMPPQDLENIIIDFAAHEYDILLSTTIIENGVDMPNVNTIIINNAHNFGLSELHQLRGRVGRSNRKAFCYLTIPEGLPLSPDARRRLQAIESFSDLGSGIHIAMQDLDIRGAGNLLGAEQSGFIADLGYETYQRILREAVMELRTGELADIAPDNPAPGSTAGAAQQDPDFVTDCIIESDLELLFPTLYVPQENERITLYRRLDNIETAAQLETFRRGIIDRFGQLPPQAEELLQVPNLRRLGHALGLEKILLRNGDMYLYVVDESNVAYHQSDMFGRLMLYAAQNPRRVTLRERGTKSGLIIIKKVPGVTAAVNILRTIHAL